LEYRPKEVSQAIHETHEMFKRNVGKEAVNLRDISRFKIFYKWFMEHMPSKPVSYFDQQDSTDYNHNYKIGRKERAFILSICFCYLLRLDTFQKRDDYLRMIEKIMGYT
jgi:hypothetical protein